MDELLNKLIPVPDEDELEIKIKTDLASEGFSITNFRSGGVFRTIIRIFLKIYVELLTLCRKVLKNSFIETAEESWLDLKGADFYKIRKVAEKARGYITLSRGTLGRQITIPKGYVFKTEPDSTGEELRYVNLETKILLSGETELSILVEAESIGAKYNVPAGQIVKSLIYIDGIDSITNSDGWIAKEGTDRESDESFRARIKNSWAELSANPIRDKYKNIAEGVQGVFAAEVDDMHPRGQGTIDISITSSAGEPTQSLLDAVTAACEEIKGPYDNILVKAAVTVPVDVKIVLVISSDANDEGLAEKAAAALNELFLPQKIKNLNELFVSEIIYSVRKSVNVKNVQIVQPSADAVLPKGQIILKNSVEINIERA